MRYSLQIFFQFLSYICSNFEMQMADIIVLHLDILLSKPGGFTFPAMDEETIL
jgi:hypothetical protein